MQRFESAYGASAAAAVAYEYNTEFSHTLQVHRPKVMFLLIAKLLFAPS